MDRRHLCKIGLAGIGTLALSKPLSAMEHYAKASEQKTWCILYGSQCGSTRDYANYINDGLGGIADVVDIAVTTPQVSDYDHFIIGGWINGGDVFPESIPNFVTANKDALKDKIEGLFTVCGNRGDPIQAKQINDYLTTKLVADSGVTDKPAKLFPGRNIHSCSEVTYIREYDLVSEDDGVAFGQSILTTAVKSGRWNSSQRFGLSQNSPNLFSPTNTIRYTLPKAANVELTVCALNGKRVATLASGLKPSGRHEVTWDAGNLAPGYYLYRLEAGDFVETLKAKLVLRQ